MAKHHKEHSHHSGMHGDPDKGPPMHEGAHHWDKGYVGDNDKFDPYSHNHHERGNSYFKLQNEIVHRDTKKLSREKFSKIA
jgi:hypothetical protein